MRWHYTTINGNGWPYGQGYELDCERDYTDQSRWAYRHENRRGYCESIYDSIDDAMGETVVHVMD